MRVVVDPNVLVSAAVASGVSARLLDRWLTERPFELVVCPALIRELRDVPTRDRFRRWISTAEAERLLVRIETEAVQCDDPVDVPAVTADPKDDYLVPLYRDCEAEPSSRKLAEARRERDLLKRTVALWVLSTP